MGRDNRIQVIMACDLAFLNLCLSVGKALADEIEWR